MSTNFVFGAVNDEDESLKGKSGGGKFGLNHGNITKLEFTNTAGKDNGPGDAVDIWFQIESIEEESMILLVTYLVRKTLK